MSSSFHQIRLISFTRQMQQTQAENPGKDVPQLVTAMRIKLNILYFTLKQCQSFLSKETQGAELRERVKIAIGFINRALVDLGALHEFKPIAPGPYPTLTCPQKTSVDDLPLVVTMSDSSPGIDEPPRKKWIPPSIDLRIATNPELEDEADLTDCLQPPLPKQPETCQKCRNLMLTTEQQKIITEELRQQAVNLNNQLATTRTQLDQATLAKQIMETDLEQLTVLLFSQANAMVESETRLRHEAEYKLKHL
jgi:hypothetical protein